jgi:hypothetical protein
LQWDIKYANANNAVGIHWKNPVHIVVVKQSIHIQLVFLLLIDMENTEDKASKLRIQYEGNRNYPLKR